MHAKYWLIMGAVLVLLGVILFAGVMMHCNWDFSKLSTTEYVTTTHSVTKPFHGISISTDTADIIFQLSDDGNCHIESFDDVKIEYSVSVNEGILTVKTIDQRKWNDHIGISLQKSKMTVYLPETEYKQLTVSESTGDIGISKEFMFENIDIAVSTGDVFCYASADELLKIQTNTGDIRIENVTAGSAELTVSTGQIHAEDITCSDNIEINVSTGNVNLSDISCRNFITNGSTGKVHMTDVIAAEQFSIARSTGNITMEKCDAAVVFAKTTTGDITGTLLTDKVFFAETNTGKVDVPKTVNGGRCVIQTDTGDIKLIISN